jgi:hypothetical protein
VFTSNTMAQETQDLGESARRWSASETGRQELQELSRLLAHHRRVEGKGLLRLPRKLSGSCVISLAKYGIDVSDIMFYISPHQVPQSNANEGRKP